MREFLDDEPLTLAAALSYYTLLSLAPLVLVVTAIAGLAFGREAVEGRLVGEMRGLVGEAGAEVIQTVIQKASGPERGVVSLVVGIATLVLGATTVFVQLQSALNKIWDVEADPPKNKIWSFVKTRLVSFAMVLGLGFLLAVSLIVSAALSAFGAWFEGYATLTPVIWQVVNTLISLGVFTLLFAMIFKVLPDVELAWRDVWWGATVTAVLLTIGKYLIGLYLGRASIASSYGAAGSVVVLLVWIYYAALIVFLGAEITHVHTRAAGEEAPPTENAVPAAR